MPLMRSGWGQPIRSSWICQIMFLQHASICLSKTWCSWENASLLSLQSTWRQGLGCLGTTRLLMHDNLISDRGDDIGMLPNAASCKSFCWSPCGMSHCVAQCFCGQPNIILGFRRISLNLIKLTPKGGVFSFCAVLLCHLNISGATCHVYMHAA